MDELLLKEKAWKQAAWLESPRFAMRRGRLDFCMDGCKAAREAAYGLIREGLNYIGDEFNFPVRPEDVEKLSGYLAKKTPAYLVLLTSYGAEAFKRRVAEDAGTMQFLLDAASVRDEDGSLFNWKGERLDRATGAWVSENGKAACDPLSTALWSIRTSIGTKA